MFSKSRISLLLVWLLPGGLIQASPTEQVETVALWLFDEAASIYPSCVLNDSSLSDYPLVIGPGGQLVEGKFGRALEATQQPAINYPDGGSILFGLSTLPTPAGRSVEPMNWKNANFCALMTSGENHLRKEVGFPNVTETALNLGAFDWTVEFWFQATQESNEPSVIFEIGEGPRGENDHVTRLLLNPGGEAFTFENQPSGTSLRIRTDVRALNAPPASWHHLAFVYSLSDRQLIHYLDGVQQPLPHKVSLTALPQGEEAYLSIGRDGSWGRPIGGRIDEMRFSKGQVYRGRIFTPPESFAPAVAHDSVPFLGPPLLWEPGQSADPVIELGNRKHLFIDSSLVKRTENVVFRANPPRLAERVIDNIEGPFRKHLSVVEDEDGLIRLYNGTWDDYLAVRTSRDGIHWEIPKLEAEHRGMPNIAIAEPTGEGNAFVDPNAPPEGRWKYVSGSHKRGVYLYESSDGWSFNRFRTAVLPFRSGSQSNVFYDDQRGLYVGFHRSDYPTTTTGKTQREFVMTEAENVSKPWPFHRVSQAEAIEVAKTKRLHDLHPWYLDNGPLTPGGFGIEYPAVFAPDDSLDPPGTDFYVPKAMKYPWAPDTYLAFPVVYFHYEGEKPRTRNILGDEDRQRGSGPIEAQLAVSRDGINWTRYPRPAYIGRGDHDGREINQVYISHGMVRRGDEIWQYYYGTVIYHSSWTNDDSLSAVYRVVQRLDGFVSADTPYERDGLLETKPFRFEGNRLVLNIDTEATGYAQVGFLDEQGQPIKGYSVGDCIYINEDSTAAEVEWLGHGKDVSSLQGKVVQLVFRMRGSKLFAMQFKDQ